MLKISNLGGSPVNKHALVVTGMLVVLVVLLFLTFLLDDLPGAGIFWIVGIGFGITVQRSRFCFTSAFRDFFLLGQTKTLKGILLGLAICSVGFVMIMSTTVPDPSFGFPPSDAHILPVGLSTIVAGVLFGVGMVVAGGCVSGSLYRMGEGYLTSWTAMFGVMIGLFFLNNSWNWWWDNIVSHEPKIWLPTDLTYVGALVVTGALLLLVLYFAVWRERKATAGFVMPSIKKRAQEIGPPTTSFAEIFGYVKTIFTKEWSPLVGGIMLAVLNILLFIRFHPLGVVGEISRWTTSFADSVGLPELSLRGLEGLGACAMTVAEGSWFTDGFFLVCGIVAGSALSAVGAKEFKLRISKSPRRYLQTIAGGIVMGYGAGLGLGCTLGGFFSAIPSLALNGWVYAVGLTVGAFIGVQIIKRFP